jgi:hypothetical protein
MRLSATSRPKPNVDNADLEAGRANTARTGMTRLVALLMRTDANRYDKRSCESGSYSARTAPSRIPSPSIKN